MSGGVRSCPNSGISAEVHREFEKSLETVLRFTFTGALFRNNMSVSFQSGDAGFTGGDDGAASGLDDAVKQQPDFPRKPAASDKRRMRVPGYPEA